MDKDVALRQQRQALANNETKIVGLSRDLDAAVELLKRWLGSAASAYHTADLRNETRALLNTIDKDKG